MRILGCDRKLKKCLHSGQSQAPVESPRLCARFAASTVVESLKCVFTVHDEELFAMSPRSCFILMCFFLFYFAGGRLCSDRETSP